MWSRVRHRSQQAGALVALAALLTLGTCLGPLYQRAMEQALAGSVVAHAAPIDRALRLDSSERSVAELEDLLPTEVARWFSAPISALDVPVGVDPPDGGDTVITRLYAVDGACTHLEVVAGRCPAAADEVMVSAADSEQNGWTVGSQVDFVERVAEGETAEPGTGRLSVVGVYRSPGAEEWLGAPITNRVGTVIPDVGPATDDWVTVPETITSSAPPTIWHRVSRSVVWSLTTADHDALLRIGPAVGRLSDTTLMSSGNVDVLATTDLPDMAEEVADGSEQGRTTVVVLVSQLLVLVTVVLWMVLVAAADDRRPELALARLRGRGRRGAAAYLLAELVPLTLAGVALGALAAPFAMGLVARVVFPVSVPRELPDGFLVATLVAAVAVVAVVLAVAWRAVREPVDSLLRAVPARRGGRGAGPVEVAITVFSLTAVVALLTGNLEGPLATLAPTLLALAAGLLLARALAPALRHLAGRLLRGGRAVAATGLVTAVRRPAARRVLVMVVVATALITFCLDALVTGQHNRQRAAEQLNGAPLSLRLDPSARLDDVLAGVRAADPEHRHLTPVVTSTNNGSRTAPTVAVDPATFPEVTFGPPTPASGWRAIQAPDVAPLELTGATVAGVVASAGVRLGGPSRGRTDELTIALRVLNPDRRTLTEELSVVPLGDGSATFSVPVPCADGCTVTGVVLTAPVASRTDGTVVLRDLSVDGRPFSLGPPTDWRAVSDLGGTLQPQEDPAGGLAIAVAAEAAAPPVLTHGWVPQPVPALVSGAETDVFAAPGPFGQVELEAVGELPRVPGSPPGSRVVDLEGILRRPESTGGNVIVAVWADDTGALDRARRELQRRGVGVDEVTTVQQVRAELDASPAAWSLALSVLVGIVAVVVAALVVVVTAAASWRTRARDLAALRMAGLPTRLLLRLELLGQLPVVVLGGLAGVACGLVAGVVALPGVRQFTDPPAVDTTDFATPWAVVLLGAGAATLVLVGVVAAAARWTERRARLDLLQEVV